MHISLTEKVSIWIPLTAKDKVWRSHTRNAYLQYPVYGRYLVVEVGRKTWWVVLGKIDEGVVESPRPKDLRGPDERILDLHVHGRAEGLGTARYFCHYRRARAHAASMNLNEQLLFLPCLMSPIYFDGPSSYVEELDAQGSRRCSSF